jgi:hypothetical protein
MIGDPTATAVKSASTRWFGDIQHAVRGFEVGPLGRDEIRFSCFVLDGGKHLISRCQVLRTIGFQSGGTRGADELSAMLDRFAARGIDCSTLAERVRNPILLRPAQARALKYSYPADVLEEACYSIIWADARELLMGNERRLATRCDGIIRSFEPDGIAALLQRGGR